MGPILAMAAVVTVIAGAVTITINSLHNVFSKANPTDKDLMGLIEQLISGLRGKKAELMPLKEGERDLIAMKPKEDLKLIPGKYRKSGTIQTIYKEPVAYYAVQEFPKAKKPHQITLIQTLKNSYVFVLKDDMIKVSVNGTIVGSYQKDALVPPKTVTPLVWLEKQRDQRTIHVETEHKTLATILIAASDSKVVPRLFEFVDVCNPQEESLLELMCYYYVVSNNI